MKKILCVILSFLILSFATPVIACSQSDGKSKKDKQVAARICKVFKDFPGILMISVQESILYVDISKVFYNEMMKDKLETKKLIKIWMRGMRKESGKKIVTVWVYVDTIKVIEGNTSWTGEDKFKFF